MTLRAGPGRLRRAICAGAVAAAGVAAPAVAHAAEGAPAVDGRALGLVWVLPFAGLLAAIAVLPVAAARFWHHHYGKVALAAALGFLLPCAAVFGIDVALYELLHALLLEYVPFVVLLLALYTVAGGVRITGAILGTPLVNTAILAIGTVIASWMGTTGACMLLIHPLIRANQWRRNTTHIFVFFIFLVGNVGGALTPLGDPPLFIGFLAGVDFFWVTARMLGPMLIVAVPLLAVFYAIDTWRMRSEAPPPANLVEATGRVGIEGRRNLVLLAAAVGAVLLSGVWQPEITFTIHHVELALEDVVRTVLLLAIAGLSVAVTRRETRAANEFSWFPMVEVAKLFFGIFVTIVPAIAIIKAGAGGAARDVVALVNPAGVPDPAMYFWVTGLLSSVLDNAPTYLIFFNLAGGDAAALMGPLSQTLLAISAGAVFMGAVTYIGNAPNFMVKAVVEARGLAMPSFFAYAGWAIVFLMPLFGLATFVYFR